MNRGGQEPDILVGVGGSGASLAALLWAAREARRRDARLWVIQAWQARPARAPYAGTCHAVRDTELQAAAADRLAAYVRAGLSDVTGADVAIDLIEGVPERVLAEASANAGLLVLGAGSHAVVAQADPLSVDRPIGPVVRACLSHARCPVVIIGPVAAEQERGPAGLASHGTRSR